MDDLKGDYKDSLKTIPPQFLFVQTCQQYSSMANYDLEEKMSTIITSTVIQILGKQTKATTLIRTKSNCVHSCFTDLEKGYVIYNP